MSISPLSSSLRIGGLASGLDTEELVRKIMQAEQIKVDRIVQQKTKLEWEQTARKDLLAEIQSFRTSVMSALASETNLNTASAYNAFKVKTEGDSLSVSLSASSEATQGSYVINEISQLAKASYVESTAMFQDLDLSMSLGVMASYLPLSFGGDNADMLSFEINGTRFDFKESATIRDVFAAINSSDSGVKIGYSQLTGKIKMTADQTGAGSQIAIENIDGNFFGPGSPLGLQSGLIDNGQDAVLRINGTVVTSKMNVFTLDGVTYNLVAESVVPMRFTIEKNMDETVNRIKNFINQYNSLIDSFNSKLNEQVFREFTPLTEAQKIDMSESEIRLWEEKARSGLLHNDRDLMRLTDQLRTAVFDSVEGTNLNLASIGISTGSYLERGKLYLDETKLRQALEKDSDGVMQLFMQEENDEDPAIRYRKGGLLQRFRDALTDYSGKNVESAYNEKMIKITRQIARYNQNLVDKENQYWRQFSAMEQALASLNAQSNWLYSVLGSSQ